MKVLVLTLVGVMALITGCSRGGIAFEFYVVVKPNETSRFLAAVTAIAKDAGLEVAQAEAVADTGSVLRVVEGRGEGFRLWVESTLLSGKEDPKLCGEHAEPHSDPAQFTVFTEARFLGSNADAAKFGERVFFELQKAKFDVRKEPVICGTAAINQLT